MLSVENIYTVLSHSTQSGQVEESFETPDMFEAKKLNIEKPTQQMSVFTEITPDPIWTTEDIEPLDDYLNECLYSYYVD